MRIAPVIATAAVTLASMMAPSSAETTPAEKASAKKPPQETTTVDPTIIRSDVAERLAKFVPTRIEADLSHLSPTERQVLDKLVAASRLIGDVFLRQAWADNPPLRGKLAAAAAAPGAPQQKNVALDLFDVNAGVWDRLDEEPFIGMTPRPKGAGFYPPDMIKEELEDWLKAHPGDTPKFQSLFTVIRRGGGGLKPIAYSEAYKAQLEPAAALLREAAALTDNGSLKTFLEKRAAAFLDDDYYASDVAWMDLDSKIEVTIGPYETYEDRLFGYKAAFESFVTLKDAAASEKLARYKGLLPEMERNLPIPDEHKNLQRGTESPIGVVDVVYTAGDTRAGVQTIAYNLPNDERVRQAKGSKKILLRNVMNAKFDAILEPIASKLVAPDQLSLVTADAFFNETLFHELSHGLGPGKIKVGGRETEVRLELKDLYSALEEAKADVMGVYNVFFLAGKGMFPETFRKEMAATFLAGMFRSVRFGIEEAHGKGVALQYNWFKERGAFTQDASRGVYSVDFAKFEPALRDIVREICMVQAMGDYNGAKKLFDRYATLPPELQSSLGRLKGIPVDIRPVYIAAGERE